jgi:hypothetical protein
MRMTVDADFDGGVVRRLRTPSAAAGVRHASALLVGCHEQPMRPGVGVNIEPRPALGSCERMQIERDRRMDDVVVVDLR